MKKSFFKIETLRNEGSHIFMPISIWPGFMWILGKLNSQTWSTVDRENIRNVIIYQQLIHVITFQLLVHVLWTTVFTEPFFLKINNWNTLYWLPGSCLLKISTTTTHHTSVKLLTTGTRPITKRRGHLSGIYLEVLCLCLEFFTIGF